MLIGRQHWRTCHRHTMHKEHAVRFSDDHIPLCSVSLMFKWIWSHTSCCKLRYSKVEAINSYSQKGAQDCCSGHVIRHCRSPDLRLRHSQQYKSWWCVGTWTQWIHGHIEYIDTTRILKYNASDYRTYEQNHRECIYFRRFLSQMAIFSARAGSSSFSSGILVTFVPSSQALGFVLSLQISNPKYSAKLCSRESARSHGSRGA